MIARRRAARFALLLPALGASTLRAQDTAPRTAHEMHAVHRDSKAYIAMLEDPGRDAYQKPDEVVRALALAPGAAVADIGAGSGYFAVRLAKAVGDTGRVYAVDISPDMVVHLNRRLRDAGIPNVQTVLSAPDDPLLPDASVDLVFICDTWHHIDERPKYLALLKRVLRPAGRIAIVDFQKRPLSFGPPLEMKIAREEVVGELQDAGFRLTKEHTFLPHQYFLVFGAR
jgi:ubiquinone/menaquinone biosynthesis C-methylase UbiE